MPLLRAPPKLADGLVHDRVVKRVPRSEQVGARLAVGLDVREVEGNAVVLGGDRAVLAGADLGGHVGDLVASLLALGDAAAEPGEGGLEGQLDVVRLQAAGAGLIHRCAQRAEVGVGEVIGSQCPLVEDLLEPVADAGVDDLMHLRLHVGPLAVVDGVQQQVAQRGLVERFAEHVEDLAAVGLALLLDLVQQPGEDLAFAGVAGDEVPQPADLFLADAVDAAEALLDAVGVPRQVVVDHQVRGLQVQAFAGSVGGEQDLAVAVLGELLGDQAALSATYAAVDRLARRRACRAVSRSWPGGSRGCRGAQ